MTVYGGGSIGGCVALVAGVLVLAFSGGAKAATPTATEFPVAVGFPTHVTAGPDGNVWFTTPAGNGTVGRITPAGNVLQMSADNSPQNITAGPDGNLWFSKLGQRFVTRTTPDGVQVSFGPGAGPLAWRRGITAGPDGGVWYVEAGNNAIVRLSKTGPGDLDWTETIWHTGANDSPNDITTGPDGNLWFTMQLGNGLGRITPAGEITRFTAGIGGSASPGAIAVGPDGNLWFTEPGLDRIGRLNPATGAVTEFTAGITPGARLEDIVAGPDGNIWFTEYHHDQIGRITPSGVVTEFPAGISPGAEPDGITTGADGNLWVAEFSGQKIARINTAEDPPAFRNSTPIALPASGTAAGPGSLYPSPIEVSGLQGQVTDVDVRLTGISHQFMNDLEFLLVGPQGQAVLLVSDVGSGNPDPHGITLKIDDEAPFALPAGGPNAPVVSGPYRPLDRDDGFPDDWPAPAPARPYATQLTAFDGAEPNGTWQLFARDDSGSDVGNLFGGWGLDVRTNGPPGSNGGGGDGTPDTSVELSVGAKGKQKLKKLAIEVGCGDEECTVEAGGTASAKPKKKGRAALKKKKFALAPESGSAPAGDTVTLDLDVKGKKKAKALTKLVKKKAKAKAAIEVIATDAAGNTATEDLSVALKK